MPRGVVSSPRQRMTAPPPDKLSLLARGARPISHASCRNSRSTHLRQRCAGRGQPVRRAPSIVARWASGYSSPTPHPGHVVPDRHSATARVAREHSLDAPRYPRAGRSEPLPTPHPKRTMADRRATRIARGTVARCAYRIRALGAGSRRLCGIRDAQWPTGGAPRTDQSLGAATTSVHSVRASVVYATSWMRRGRARPRPHRAATAARRVCGIRALGTRAAVA